MQENIDYRLLKNFSEGRYSLRDFKHVVSWFEDKSLRTDIESAIQTHWEEFEVADDVPKKDLSKVYDRLKNQILLEQTKNITLQRRIILSYSKIAAILLLPLFIYTAYSLINKYGSKDIAWAEIYSPSGARIQFHLPDGTMGWLNSNTKLKYPLNFKEDRHLELSGEAYFEVAHNKKSPFVVTTSNFDIKVVGTIFSVSAIEDEKTTEVVLQEGKVIVENPGISLNTTMNPDQKLVFDNLTKRYVTSETNAKQMNAWKDGLLVFRNEPLSEVFRRLGRWYNVKITVKDDQMNQFKYRATFHDEPIEEVIRLISLTAPIDFTVQNRKQEDQGVYAIKEILIRKK